MQNCSLFRTGVSQLFWMEISESRQSTVAMGAVLFHGRLLNWNKSNTKELKGAPLPAGEERRKYLQFDLDDRDRLAACLPLFGWAEFLSLETLKSDPFHQFDWCQQLEFSFSSDATVLETIFQESVSGLVLEADFSLGVTLTSYMAGMLHLIPAFSGSGFLVWWIESTLN